MHRNSVHISALAAGNNETLRELIYLRDRDRQTLVIWGKSEKCTWPCAIMSFILVVFLVDTQNIGRYDIDIAKHYVCKD